MPRDQHGLLMTGPEEAVGHYDRAIDALLHFRDGCLDESERSLAADPGFPMGHALRAYLRLLTTEVEDHRQAKLDFERFAQSDLAVGGLHARERHHLQAIESWIGGDMAGAGSLLREILLEHPRDALAMAVGHQIDFFTGDARALRDRVGEALAAWHEDDPHLGPVLGMHAFGLEECGDYGASEEVGRRAVTLDPRDVWGIHSVAHTYEMQGRFGDGTSYFDERLESWTAPDNFFSPHNWWHYCLYALESGNVERALEIYDRELHNDRVELLAMQMLDATALLWRLYLDGHDQTRRWLSLAAAWDTKMDTPFYAFNDMHATMAYVGAGELARARRLVSNRRDWVARETAPSTNRRVTATFGIPVCEAIVAFGRGRYGDAVDLLVPIRHTVQGLGGSHAQRDAVQKTLLEAAIRARRLDLAQALIDERLAVRPSSPYNWLGLARIRRARQDEPGEQRAVSQAKRLAGTGGRVVLDG